MLKNLKNAVLCRNMQLLSKSEFRERFKILFTTNNDDYIALSDVVYEDDPPEDEVENYAQYLGMKLPEDNAYLWIAKEALQTPLPPEWKAYQKKDDSGQPFYFNSKTGESIWEHPLDESFRKKYQEEKKKQTEKQNNDAKSRQNTVQNLESPKPRKSSNKSTTAAANPLFSDVDSDSDSVPRLVNKNSPAKTNSNSTNNIPKQTNPQTKQTTTINTFTSVTKQPANITTSTSQKTLEELRAKNQQKIDAENEKHQQNLRELRDKHNSELNQEKSKLREQFNKDVQTEKQYYDNELQKIRTQNQQNLTDAQKSTLEQQKNTFENQKKQLELNNANEIEDIKKKHQREINFINSTFEQEKKLANDSKSLELTKLKKSHEFEKTDMERKYKEEIDSLKKKHSQEVESITRKQEQEIKALNQKHEQQIKEMQKNIKVQIDQTQVNKEAEAYKKALEKKKEKITQNFNQQMEKIYATQHEKKKEVTEQLKKEFIEFRTNQQQKMIAAKRKIADNNEIIEMQNNFEIKKKTIENQQKDEINNLTEEHRREIEDLKKKHNKLIQLLNEEDEEMKQEATTARQNFMNKKKRELARLSAQFDEQIYELHEKYEQRKKREKQAFMDELKEDIEEIGKKARLKLSMYSSIPVAIKPRSSSMRTSSHFVFSQKPEDKQNETFNPQMMSANSQLMAMNSQIYPQSMIQPKYSMFDDGLSDRIRKGQGKATKFEDQFNTTCDNLENGIRESSNKVSQLTNTYRNFVQDQNKQLSQYALDFQNQTTQISLGMHSVINDIQNTFSNAIAVINSRSMTAMPVAMPSERRSNRPSSRRRMKIVDDSMLSTEMSESELLDADARKMLKLWRDSNDDRRQ